MGAALRIFNTLCISNNLYLWSAVVGPQVLVLLYELKGAWLTQGRVLFTSSSLLLPPPPHKLSHMISHHRIHNAANQTHRERRDVPMETAKTVTMISH